MTNRLYAYDLPDKIVKELSVFGESAQDESTVFSDLKSQEKWAPGVCSSCGKFNGDTRSHYKADYHRYNIRRSLKNVPALTEEQFDEQIGDVDESISGSESESSDDEDPKNTIATKGSPQILFNLNQDDEKCLKVYKTLLKNQEKLVDSLLDIQKQKSCHSVVLMIGGGHFSGAIISHDQTKQKNTPSSPYASIRILEHKTFHRYTTRRKQGGAQSASDNSRGKANSAGSSLRRYNEQALTQDIRQLLESWRGLIDRAEAIHVRASGRSNRGILMNYDKAPIISTDERLKSVPFTTKRATGSEIKRVWKELTTAYIVDKPKLEPNKIKTKAEPKKKVSQSKSPSPAPISVSPEERHSTEIMSLIKKSKAPRLMAYLKMSKLSPDFELVPVNANTPTPLFYASSQGQKQIIRTLLASKKVDIARKNKSGKTAFEIANGESARHAFQIYRHEHPTDYDWEAARVGKPISPEEIELEKSMEQMEVAKEQTKQLEDFKKQYEDDKLDRFISKHGNGNRLISVIPGNDLSGLSEEAQRNIERERRARAAEARFRK